MYGMYGMHKGIKAQFGRIWFLIALLY
jgi:hypothetical protein